MVTPISTTTAPAADLESANKRIAELEKQVTELKLASPGLPTISGADNDVEQLKAKINELERKHAQDLAEAKLGGPAPSRAAPPVPLNLSVTNENVVPKGQKSAILLKQVPATAMLPDTNKEYDFTTGPTRSRPNSVSVKGSSTELLAAQVEAASLRHQLESLRRKHGAALEKVASATASQEEKEQLQRQLDSLKQEYAKALTQAKSDAQTAATWEKNRASGDYARKIKELEKSHAEALAKRGSQIISSMAAIPPTPRSATFSPTSGSSDRAALEAARDEIAKLKAQLATATGQPTHLDPSSAAIAAR